MMEISWNIKGVFGSLEAFFPQCVVKCLNVHRFGFLKDVWSYHISSIAATTLILVNKLVERAFNSYRPLTGDIKTIFKFQDINLSIKIHWLHWQKFQDSENVCLPNVI